MDMDEDELPPAPPPGLIWTEEKKELARRIIAPALLSLASTVIAGQDADPDDINAMTESINDMQSNRTDPIWETMFSPELLVQLNRLITSGGLNSNPNARFNQRVPLAHVPWRKDKRAEFLAIRAATTFDNISGCHDRLLGLARQAPSNGFSETSVYKPWTTLLWEKLALIQADKTRLSWHITNGTVTLSLLDEFDEVYNEAEYAIQDNELRLVFLQAQVKDLERQLQEEKMNKDKVLPEDEDDGDDDHLGNGGCATQGKSKAKRHTTFNNISLAR